MQLSKRLQRVVANVRSKGVVADIGCDHGFTSIALVQGKKAAAAIAMDIGKEPLARAREHVLQHGLSDQIALRLSDGAKQLLPGEADTLLISGMGGALICKILMESRETVAAAAELVLSPQSEVFRVRRCVHAIGFQIAAEEMVFDQGKYYVILRAVPGQETYQREMEYLYGKKLLEKKDGALFGFLQKEAERVCRILQHLEKQELSKEGKERKRKLQQEKAQIQQAMDQVQGQKGGQAWEIK